MSKAISSFWNIRQAIQKASLFFFSQISRLTLGRCMPKCRKKSMPTNLYLTIGARDAILEWQMQDDFES
jgi:hypothetical protein